jgi:hypothetical protein
MQAGLTRREAVCALGATLSMPAAPAKIKDLESAVVQQNDRGVESILRRQITDPQSRWRGGYPDQYGIQEAGSAGGVLATMTAAFLHKASKYYKNRQLVERMKLAAGYLERAQSPEGFISLLATNFNSPPDTAFVVHGVASAACLAQRAGEKEIFGIMEPFLRKAGAGLAVGGVHTPNHRWVVSEALAQIDEVLPEEGHRRRIEQWLAEGIDIDEEGQYTERSSSIYNTVVNRALTVLSLKLKRPELLQPVRRNLDAMLYLMHPDFEVVTEISRRQDKDLEADAGRYWLPYRLLAVRDGNGQFATVADHFTPQWASLTELMQYPELLQPGPALKPIPDDYERRYKVTQIARIRRGLTSATMLLGGASKFLTFRRGDVVVNGVRMASTFFGKGQFVPRTGEKRGGSYHFEEVKEAGYFQPLDPVRTITTRTWYPSVPERHRTQICRLNQEAIVTERKNGLEVRFRMDGTADVPMAVEISFREGGKLEGCVPSLAGAGSYILPGGYGVYRVGKQAIRFGPGAKAHGWTELRRVEPRMQGVSVYLTAFTPFDHTVTFEWA